MLNIALEFVLLVWNLTLNVPRSRVRPNGIEKKKK